MKKNHYLIAMACAMLVIAACKKAEQPVINQRLALNQKELTGTATTRPLTVVTLAGQSGQQGYVDGPGNQALFYNPSGISIAEDGSLYVIDNTNRKIRKVNTGNVVSTVNIPPSADGQTLTEPGDVFVGKDGTLTILQSVHYLDQVKHRFWIVSPNGEVSTPPMRTDNYWDYSYSKIAYDPYSNFLKTCGGRRVEQHPSQYTPFMEDLEIRNGVMGTNRYVPPIDSFAVESQGVSTFTVIFCGYNGVKYFVSQNRYVFKLTPSGVFTRIFREFDLNGITSIVATKDSRTVYIVNRGRIEAISNGKKQFLVGPNQDFNAPPDGVGSQANVQANRLALSKDESTLYFTDSRFSTVRKLILR
jgi:hypothetical protein